MSADQTPDERAAVVATLFNANNPGHFPGRPLLEGAITNAITAAVDAERARCIGIVREHRPGNSIAWYHPWTQIDSILAELAGEPNPCVGPYPGVDRVVAERQRCLRLVEDFAGRNPNVGGFGSLFALIVGGVWDETQTETRTADGGAAQPMDTQRPT